MAKPITAKINVTRILKEHLYAGKNGKYLDLVIWPNKDGADQYGNTHMVTQAVSKEARESGVKGPILGNLKMPGTEQRQAQERRPASAPRPPKDPALDVQPDDIPF